MDLSFKTSEELQQILGARLRALRLRRNQTQQEVAEKAGVGLRSLRSLELGAGSSVETLLRVLKSLGAVDAIDLLAPAPTVSPLALLRQAKTRQRVRHPRTPPA